MCLWTSYWGNNPYDDYNLIIEICFNNIDNEVAIIKQSQQGLIFQWYKDPKGFEIPISWLFEKLIKAKEGIIDPTTIEEDIIIKKWTACWANDLNDDCKLILEILCDDVEVAVIKQSEQGLVLKWYSCTKGTIILVDWLLWLLSGAMKDLNIIK